MAKWRDRAGLAAVATVALVGLTGAGQLARSSARADTSGGEAAAPLVISTEAEFQTAAAGAGGPAPAFLQYGVAEGIVFAPDPIVVARAFSQPWNAAVQWRPEAVAVSSGGDLAASTGPSRITNAGGESQTGWYLTVWRRQGDGFRYALDAAVRTDGDYLNAAPTPYDIIVARGRPGAGFNLQDLERDYAGDAARDARRATLDRVEEDHGRLLRDGARPSIGRAQAQTLLAAGPAQVRMTYRDGSVSNTGDLAYAWGEATWTDGAGASQRGFYTHVWIRNGREWKIIMDMLTLRREPPLPAPAAPAAPEAVAAPTAPDATAPAPAAPTAATPPTAPTTPMAPTPTPATPPVTTPAPTPQG